MEETKTTHPNPLGLSKGDLESLFEATFDNETNEKLQNSTQKGGYFNAKNAIENQTTAQYPISNSEVEISKPDGADKRGKSSLRLKYEAEVSHIMKTHGGLEEIRRSLGLSKRKIAQLLLVDPSAWTRWTSKKGEVPPHIYRALQWFLLLQEKHPEYRSALWLNAVASPQLSQKEIDAIKKEVLSSARQEFENVEFDIRGESFKDRHLFQKRLEQAAQAQSLLAEELRQTKKLLWIAIAFSLLLVPLIFLF